MKNFNWFLVIFITLFLITLFLTNLFFIGERNIERDRNIKFSDSISILKSRVNSYAASIGESTTFEYNETLEDMCIRQALEYMIVFELIEVEGEKYSNKHITIYGDYDFRASPYKVKVD